MNHTDATLAAPFPHAPRLLSRLTDHLSRNRFDQFLVILLDERDEVIDLVALSDGLPDGDGVHPRDAVRLILDREAAAVIFVHNHPAGKPEPTPADQRLALRLDDACRGIDVQVYDHLIIASGDTWSFAAGGLVTDKSGATT